jgi:hypothetical protein
MQANECDVLILNSIFDIGRMPTMDGFWIIERDHYYGVEHNKVNFQLLCMRWVVVISIHKSMHKWMIELWWVASRKTIEKEEIFIHINDTNSFQFHKIIHI